MKVLYSAKGESVVDFCFTDDGEAVKLPSHVCASKACGCGSGFVGMDSRRSTTLAVVRDVPLSRQYWIEQWRQSESDAGYGEEDIAELVDRIINFADRFQVGDKVRVHQEQS